ncbi:MAG TPA: ADP-ribosylglycohydrolase family protein [Polyangiaceae bacterium]|nr:ADP-ribosylglycohydrolase family protein [Polyangiaceae bacterium]
MLALNDRLSGGLVGLLVGDALGVPYEFHRADALPRADQIEMAPPAGFSRSHDGVPPGTYSDDGAQALCLLASLLDREYLDPEDLGSRLLSWLEHGYLAVDGLVFDVGVQTNTALKAFAAGRPALEAGPRQESANGNGSLMRVLPLALWHRGSDAELVRDADLQSRVTHGHVRSRVCCMLYCLWARRTLAGDPSAWGSAAAALRSLLGPGEEAEALEFHIRPDDTSTEGRGSGYVVDALRSARMCAAEPTFEAAVRRAIALGDDTDTTACLTGGIVGVRDGVNSIPLRWREALRGTDLWEPLLSRLLERQATVRIPRRR